MTSCNNNPDLSSDLNPQTYEDKGESPDPISGVPTDPEEPDPEVPATGATLTVLIPDQPENAEWVAYQDGAEGAWN